VEEGLALLLTVAQKGQYFHSRNGFILSSNLNVVIIESFQQENNIITFSGPSEVVEVPAQNGAPLSMMVHSQTSVHTIYTRAHWHSVYVSRDGCFLLMMCPAFKNCLIVCAGDRNAQYSYCSCCNCRKTALALLSFWAVLLLKIRQG